MFWGEMLTIHALRQIIAPNQEAQLKQYPRDWTSHDTQVDKQWSLTTTLPAIHEPRPPYHGPMNLSWSRMCLVLRQVYVAW